MRSIGAAAVAVLTLAAGTSATTATTSASPGRPGPGAAHVRWVKVHRGGSDATVGFHRGRTGEVFLDVTVSATRVSWSKQKNTSAVVSAFVDGRYATDIVIMSSGPVRREFALGRLAAGHHTLRLHFADKRSRSRAGVARLQHIGFKTVAPGSPAYAAARNAPVLYGRDVAETGGRFQNNHTDTPLVAWHQVLPTGKPGHSLIEYSVMWSNEDGGTGVIPAALMAQWGRTTDIEWVYRVEVDAHGRRIPGTGVFQSADHGSRRFRGRYDGTHPLLETCTTNNNVCDTRVDDPMRFALSTRGVLPASQPREHEMDIHPWTYQVMAREMVREHKIEKPSRPSTVAMGDQRNYLYVAVTHDTVPAAAAAGVGLAVDVRLKGRPKPYSSDHGAVPSLFTINRDGPAATSVELPAGTKRSDIASISVRRVPVGTDNGASLTVTALDRAFFLGRLYLPWKSFARWHGSETLTGTSPTALIWTAS
jgi:hypothetical protein